MAVLGLVHALFGVLILLIAATEAASSISSTMISLPGCADTCGSVKIPYPFGTSPGCSYDNYFLLTCNHTFNPPRPTFPASNVSIIDISPDSGELRIEALVARDCYNKSGNLTNDSNPYSYTITHSMFPLSTSNMLIAVGCDTVGAIGGDRGRPYVTGCVAYCNNTNDVINGSCSGIGCCQMNNIPQGVWDFVAISLGLSKNHADVHDFNPCGFTFVAEEGAYDFSVADLMSLQRREKFPVVLDWAIGNLTCEEARKNLTAYACKARNSECLNSTNGPGYRCKCSRGFEGNPYLVHGCQDINECERSHPCNATCHNWPGGYTCTCPEGFKGDGKRDGTGCSRDRTPNFVAIAWGTCTGLLVLLVGGSWIYWGAKKRRLMKLKERFFQQNGGLLLQQQLLSHHRGSTETAKIFTADELNEATNNFEQSRVIGQGGYGTVYKGVLTDNKVVAIKKSRIGDQSQIEHFINEVIVLSQVNHRNVVKLLGCCLETEVPLLVYEFITNGTLSDHIHNKSGQYSTLSWKMRLKIATETAGAIAYLHSSASMPIIHRDIKTANILLDENFTAKVSDFGASRLVPLDQTQLTTLVQGTLGYLDPEYFHSSQLTEKSDVYSFGVVLAELLTGQKALSLSRPESERNLALYFTSSMKENRLLQILDEDLATEGNERTIGVVASLAKGCLRIRGEKRPTMKEVASELEGLTHKELQPWRQDHDFCPEETEYWFKRPDIDKGANYGCDQRSNTAERIESINKELLLSYCDGR